MANSFNERFDGFCDTPYAARITAATTTVAVSVPAGKFCRVRWVSVIPSSDNSNGNKVTVAFDGGRTLYVGEVISHWELLDGEEAEDVLVTTTTAEAVDVNIHFRVLDIDLHDRKVV